VAHVRRLLDIVACTTSFGPSSPPKNAAKSNKSQPPPEKQSPKDAATADGDGEISHSCPKLESFYEFFSLSHLTAPLQCTINSSSSLTLIRSLFSFSVQFRWSMCWKLMNADVKKALKRHVDEISEEDHLFSLDVSFFPLFNFSSRVKLIKITTRARVNVCLNFRYFFEFLKSWFWWVIWFLFFNRQSWFWNLKT
jgi:hypothetical protein